MASIYSDIPSELTDNQEQSFDADVTITEEVIEQQTGVDEQDANIIVQEEVEIQESIVPSNEFSSGEEPFSIAKFLGRLSVNLILPFINGLMLGFGEIIAHEIGFHYNWTGSKVYPQKRMLEKKSKLL